MISLQGFVEIRSVEGPFFSIFVWPIREADGRRCMSPFRSSITGHSGGFPKGVAFLETSSEIQETVESMGIGIFGYMNG